MKDTQTSWTEQEFIAYSLVFAANSDHIISSEETEILEERFGKDSLKKIYKEFIADNDYQRLQKVLKYIKENNFSQEDLDSLLENIKEIYQSDGHFDSMEQNTFRFLSKMFKV